jgi:cell division protein ZapD
MIKYEFPLNERVRKFLRIEEIFKNFDNQLVVKNRFDDYACFNLYFHIMATASRTDLKVELIQEVEKQRALISKKIKTKKNILAQNQLKKVKLQLEKNKTKTGFDFGRDKFLHELKTRSITPSGIIITDFPELQYWLESTAQKDRKIYFMNKIKEYSSIKAAITTLMKVLRDNIETNVMQSKNEAVQYKLNPLLKNDLVVISLPEASKYYPNISSNKYAVNIHFARLISITPFKLIKFKLGIASF